MDNMDTGNTPGLFVPDDNEDSVDIYDGLHITFSNNAEKSSPKASQLKESMDLYEELVTEEQQSRETSYSELKSRFQAAQNQIIELRRRVEQMQTQNTGLNTENCRLKKNISALLRTARQEVTRKDAEIQRLNQQSNKRHHHHQPHVNNLRDQKSSSQHSMSRPPPPPPSSLPPPSCPPPPPAPSCPLPPLPASPAREDHPPQPPRKEINPPSESSRMSGSSSSTRHSESDKRKSKHKEEKCQKLPEPTDRRHRSGSDPDKDSSAPDKNRSHKADKDTERRCDSRSCKSKHRSDRSKSPPPESAVPADDKKGSRSQDRRRDAVKMSTSDSEYSAAHSFKEGHSRDHRRVKMSDGHVRRSDSKDRKRSSSNQHAERGGEFSKERGWDRPPKDYERKENRRNEDKVSRKDKSTSREREKARSKESDWGKVDVGGKERREKTHKAIHRSSEEPNIPQKSSVEENSPNMKLCFMETLNLTLSPIKKPVLPFDASQADLTPTDKVVGDEPDDERLQPNIEDMCVIDEVNSSELEAGSGDLAEESTRTPKSSKRPRERCKDVKAVLGKDGNKSDALATDEQLKDNPAQTTSARIQRPDAAENRVTVHLTPTSPPITSLKATGISGSHEYKLASDRQVDDCGPLKVADGDTATSGRIYDGHTGNFSEKVNPGHNTGQSVAAKDPVMPDPSVALKCSTPKAAGQKSLPVDSVKEDSPLRETPAAEDIADEANRGSKLIPPTILPQDCQRGPCPPASVSSRKKDASRGTKDAEAVSSTISLDSLPREGLSLPEAIYVLTQANEDSNDSSSIAAEPSSSTGCIGIPKVSSTTGELAPPEKYAGLAFTPKKSFSPRKSCENNIEPSSSMPLLHDEDSMMNTLSNLKRIPDAISPLRSPIRITKRSHLHLHGKPSHVKSLQKDFSSSPVDANSKKLDVNKENKYPGSPANHDAQNPVDKESDLPSNRSDTDLEEGEILSESDEVAGGSPVPATKKAKLARPVGNKPSPKTLSKRKAEAKCVDIKETACVSTRSPKSRFKTVCPAASKASFSTTEEVMGTFKAVRAQIRKKYMKLHKTFPKKSFYGVMENFQESFLEFVDGAHFGQICGQAEELKSNLKKLITSVFGNVSNNGIVKRIFEQQAVDLKQKLWDFVDVQVDYLFKHIHMTLKSLCKPARAQPENDGTSGNEKVSRQPPAKKPQSQQTKAKLSPASVHQTRPCAVAPYKTGLGSRGKDIRITRAERDRRVDSSPTSNPNTQTVAVFLPSKNFPLTPEKKSNVPVASQNGSSLDKTDFELLTEQQASSLTFNLVRDTQMGEIFKCLLQGSDLLETGGIAGDGTAWALGTPRKDGERLISITTPTKFDSPSKLLSPIKFDTPSKLIATWSSISPRRLASPRSRGQIQLNPALFDESCLLEVPLESRTSLQSGSATQRTYSILSEDLAVSLTIPSPLKSDSHLSFLQPSSMHLMSTPESVISAHISEDALLDGEDASEQDIHLALDTDNSSCCSSRSSCAGRSSSSSEVLATPFVFKPDLLMQALVMEKSNDHFIVKIRQAASGADTTLTADDSLNRTLTEEGHRGDDAGAEDGASAAPLENGLFERHQAASDADVTLKEDSLHKKDSSIRKHSSEVCFSEDSQKQKNLPKATSGNPLHNSVQSPNHFFGQISQAASREEIAVITGENASHGEKAATQQGSSKAFSSKRQKRMSNSKSASDNSPRRPARGLKTNRGSQVLPSHASGSDKDEPAVSERGVTIARDAGSTLEEGRGDCDEGRKRRRGQENPRSKRFRKEEVVVVEEEENVVSDCKRDDGESKSSPACQSPNSLSAKNVVRKKGEVVVAWTRDEDRAILIDLKIKGASRETFSGLSEKLNKPSEQIAHRFNQLMKLFKKKEKMDP